MQRIALRRITSIWWRSAPESILEFHLGLRVSCSCSVSTYWLVVPPINRSCGISNGGGAMQRIALRRITSIW